MAALAMLECRGPARCLLSGRAGAAWPGWEPHPAGHLSIALQSSTCTVEMLWGFEMSVMRLLIINYRLSACLEDQALCSRLQYQKCFRDEETGNVVFQYMRSQLVTVSLCSAVQQD